MIIVGLDTRSDAWHASIRMTDLLPGVRPEPDMRCCKVLDKGETRGLTVDEKRLILANSFERLLDEVSSVALLDDGVVHIFCEESLALQNGKTTRVLGLAAGALWDRATRFNMYWHWVNVSQWQKMVGVQMSKDKSPTRKKKARDWSLEHGAPKKMHAGVAVDQDHYDADCCALYGERELTKLNT